MTSDPRQILAEAGVECAEVDVWAKDLPFVRGDAQDAILALARLVAKYKWQRDDIMREALEMAGFDPDDDSEGVMDSELADLERRWEKRENR